MVEEIAVQNTCEEPVKRRLKWLTIATQALMDFLRTPVPPGLTSEGMPEDAKIVHATFDCWQKVVTLWIESASFEPVTEKDIPYMILTFQRNYAPCAGCGTTSGVQVVATGCLAKLTPLCGDCLGKLTEAGRALRG